MLPLDNRVDDVFLRVVCFRPTLVSHRAVKAVRRTGRITLGLRTILAGFPVLIVRAVLRGRPVMLLCLVTVESLVRAALGPVLSVVVGWNPHCRARRRHLDVRVVSLLSF